MAFCLVVKRENILQKGKTLLNLAIASFASMFVFYLHILTLDQTLTGFHICKLRVLKKVWEKE